MPGRPDLLHRVGGPARVLRYDNGAVRREEWHVEGQLHRLDGPAWIGHGPAGKTTDEGYFIEGVDYTYDYREYLDELSYYDPAVLAEAYSTGRYAPLIAEGIPPLRIVEALFIGVESTEGIREVANGAPVEWVLAYEEGRSRTEG